MTDIFFGASGNIFFSSLNIMILLLMLFMSFRLYFSRRKRAYFSLALSLFVIIFQYIILIGFNSLTDVQSDLTLYITRILKVTSFLLINLGVYQLYNPSRRRVFVLFYSLLALGILISLTHFYIPNVLHGTKEQIQILQDIGLEVYMFLLIFLCFSIITPHVGQQIKYQLALSIYFIVQVVHVLNQFEFYSTNRWLSLTENVLPVLFYLLLYMFIFERVVELFQAIYQSSIRDGLTGLYNRRYFYHRVLQYVKHQIPISIVFGDIDKFKQLNDTQGHQKGDEVLRQVAQIFMEESDEIGIAGRYGGEEMVIMVTDPKVKVAELTETLRKRVEAESPITISIGYSSYKKGITAEKVIKQADDAMYHAKKSGRNNVVCYSKAVQKN